MLVPLDDTVYFNLSVDGYFNSFDTRTKVPFWLIKLVRILLMVVVGMQVIAKFNDVYGVLVTPLSWIYAGIVGGYSLLMFLIQDQVKLVTQMFLFKSTQVTMGGT